ncbi:AI-2E family transporter YdiK [Candidatus Profftia sp. (ex Adelges kitamiensis)]|uniref:AI-2E family transporter YdiK n=1 Tax=Candidatus Profftia sp. (ex Adelges kitamiensis) TaxID=2864218 RepID=UPI001CE36C9B|nr:AI-2E family transporter YdiK [Candidatus Profftia sp. (ex Adelges kitamiensis)]
MYKKKNNYDVPRITFEVLFISLMMLACFWVIKPFLFGFTWASMIVISTWPVLIKLQNIFWGKRWIAVLLMTLLLLMLFIIPVSLIIGSLIDNSGLILIWASSAKNWSIPELLWLKSIPIIGYKLYNSWHLTLTGGGSIIITKIQPYIGRTITWFVAQAAHLGSFVLHCALMLLFSALLHSHGESIALGIRQFAIRLGSERGEAAVMLAAQAIRAVALCVVVTALVQSILGGLGLAISGVRYSMLLTLLMFICCLAQLGPLLILIPAIIWLYWIGDNTHGTILVVWSCIVSILDNFLRPALISMGANLPMVLIVSGVIGGLLAFGMIGLFIGPVVLAVTYLLVSSWIHENPIPFQQNKQITQKKYDKI